MHTQTNPCEEFEIAALRRARSALGADALAALEAHLRSCPGCRGFATTAESTETALRERAREASNGRDWERVRAGFHARRRAARNSKLVGLASFVVMGGLGGWAAGPVAGAFLAVLLVGILAFVYWRFVRPEDQRARRAESLDAEMLDFYRRDLDKEIRGLRGSRLLLIVFGMLYAWNLLFMVARVIKELLRGHGFPNVEDYVFTSVVFTLIGCVMWLRGRRVLPRLLREREELGE